MSEAEVIWSRRGAAGEILLNRPKALNALTLGMVREIDRALDDFERDPTVARIVVRGAGDRAFCDGGDIRLLHDQGKAGDHAAQLAFWGEEYILNRRIRRFAKPYVSLIDGIVMGGGVGVSLHGSHVVAGPRFAFAMPEVGIGFFPDVGATYFLPRLPGEAGAWLALTGTKIGAGDALALGIAQAFVPSESFTALADALSEPGDTDAIVAHFSSPAPAPSLDRAEIDAGFASASVAEILARLEARAAAGSAFAGGAAATMRTRSPTSMAIALRQVREGGRMDIEDCMITEFRIVSRIARAHDFYEGVRAVLIDKDQSPRWQPAQIGDVRDADIDAYFAPLGADDLRFAEPA